MRWEGRQAVYSGGRSARSREVKCALALPALVLGLLAGACGPLASGDPPSADGARAAPTVARSESPPVPSTVVRMSYASTGAGSSVLWVATDAGFFQRNGIDPDMTYIESAGTTVQALVSGGVDLVQAGGTAAISGALSGADLPIFACVLNALPYRLLGDPAIVRPADLRGKRLGISRY